MLQFLILRRKFEQKRRGIKMVKWDWIKNLQKETMKFTQKLYLKERWFFAVEYSKKDEEKERGKGDVRWRLERSVCVIEAIEEENAF